MSAHVANNECLISRFTAFHVGDDVGRAEVGGCSRSPQSTCCGTLSGVHVIVSGPLSLPRSLPSRRQKVVLSRLYKASDSKAPHHIHPEDTAVLTGDKRTGWHIAKRQWPIWNAKKSDRISTHPATTRTT